MGTTTGTTEWLVRPVRPDEFEAWAQLYRGYADFYGWPTSEEQLRQVWAWIHDEHRVEALVAVPIADDREGADDGAGGAPVEAGPPVGLAHLREWVRPLRGVVCGYLDDLFVDPSARGRGAVDALFAAMSRLAAARGWPVIRWTTAEDNHRARAVYDRLAVRTSWVTYDMEIDAAPAATSRPDVGGGAPSQPLGT